MKRNTACGECNGILLVYPDSKEAALGSPGFRQVYRTLAGLPDTVVDWGWYDNKKDTIEYECREWFGEYDSIAISVPFELLYGNTVRILTALGIEPEKEKRSRVKPVVITGGAAPTINPSVAGVIADVVCVGEIETHISYKLNKFISNHQSGAAKRLTPMIGMKIPMKNRAAPDSILISDKIDSSMLAGFDNPALCTFKDAGLVEVGRGCSRGCRFCAAGHIYLPVRHRPVDNILRDASTFSGKAKRIGLVGAALSDHRSLKEILRGILDLGFGLSTSSFRADMLDDEVALLLKQGGVKTVTIAPEGGSERIRSIINKRLTEKQILDAAESCRRAGIGGLKLYYMIGLPWEKQSDIGAIIDLTAKIRDTFQGKGKKITVSINPFIPKPQTPFQWYGMAEPSYINSVYRDLKKAFIRMRGITLKTMSVRTAFMEAVISLGDEAVGRAVIDSNRADIPWKKALEVHGVDVYNLVHRMKAPDEKFSWDNVTGEKRKAVLFASFEKAQQTASTIS
ncbi:MAG: radical SAM protein [Candidatus Latescibacteria bacterium]|nr:radical SAM protein [Candidatus Latescibacterota bacterium]